MTGNQNPTAGQSGAISLGVLVSKEVGIEAEEWVRLAGLLQYFRVEAGLLRLDLEQDQVQPDRSVEDLFPLVLIAVGDTLVNVGEFNQLYVIVVITRTHYQGLSYMEG